MKPLTFGQRAAAGFHWEDQMEMRLKQRGMKVKQMPRNHPFDLLVNGHIRVDVKSAIRTSYKGSDGYPIAGWVFSNLHSPPTCDIYILICLNRSRLNIEKIYVIPATMVNQRTVTITKRDKYGMYIDAWDVFKQMRKKAFFDHPAPARRDDTPFVEEQRVKDHSIRTSAKEMAFKLMGASVGMLSGVGLAALMDESPFAPASTQVQGKLPKKIMYGVIGAGTGFGLGRLASKL
jgi:hypothetical protein